MLRALYDRVMLLAAHRNADAVLGTVSFVESSVFPIPPDALLVPMTLARPHLAWRYAAIATVTSVLGGLLGYAIGLFLFDSVGRAILEFYGAQEKFADWARIYNEYGLAIVFFAGLTPFPYKVVTIASGVSAMSLPLFVVASVVSRGLRFFLVCGLLWWFGEPMRLFIEKHLGWLTFLGGVLLVGGFVAVKFLI